ncbi:MAG: hypothetical protein HY718_11605 [Planctomycetes bacterium]|nr:hypothetical protein [Planctomycetota bacterium]
MEEIIERHYDAGGTPVPVQVYQRYRLSRGERRWIDSPDEVERWFRIIWTTLDLLPPSHVASLAVSAEGHIRVWRRPASGGGADPLGGTTPPNPHVWLSYASWQRHDINGRGDVSFTLLHEMGHQFDYWEQNHGQAGPERILTHIAADNPLGCLAILRRPHASRTNQPGEHFANVYADYFYTQRAGVSLGQASMVEECDRAGCEGLARRCRGRLARGTWPVRASEVLRLRYEAIEQAMAFEGRSTRPVAPPTGAPAAGSGEEIHGSYLVPVDGGAKQAARSYGA